MSNIDDDLNIDGQELLKFNECGDKLSSKVIKSKLEKFIFPEIKVIEEYNSKITNELDEIMNSALTENESLSNANKDTLQALSELLIYHAIIDENIGLIVGTAKNL